MSSRSRTSRVGKVSTAAAAFAALVLVAATASAQALDIAPGFTPDPQTFTGIAGGPVSAQAFESSPLGACVGYIPEAPQLEMTLGEHFEYLRVAVNGAGQDTTLVIEGPVGHWCNDDETGLDPAVFGQWAPGRYRIFVGTYAAGQAVPYTLQVTSAPPADPLATAPATPPGTPGTPGTPGLPPAGPPALPPGTPPAPYTVPPTTPPGIPVPPSMLPSGLAVPPGAYGLDTTSLTPNFGALTLAPGFLPDPQVMTGTSGGSINGGSLGGTPTGPCRGWVASNPDHVLTLSAPFSYLLVDVSSGGDTTLVIQGPHGFWCNDDSVGLNPRIGAAWSAGTYRIWVGSYAGGQYHAYTITFSEFYPR